MNFFKKLFGCKPKTHSAKGDIVLGYGEHEVIIKLDGTPCKVSLNISTPCDSVPVCHGDVNKIGVTVLENGFVLHAGIKTNTCCINWYCDTL